MRLQEDNWTALWYHAQSSSGALTSQNHYSTGREQLYCALIYMTNFNSTYTDCSNKISTSAAVSPWKRTNGCHHDESSKNGRNHGGVPLMPVSDGTELCRPRISGSWRPYVAFQSGMKSSWGGPAIDVNVLLNYVCRYYDDGECSWKMYRIPC